MRTRGVPLLLAAMLTALGPEFVWTAVPGQVVVDPGHPPWFERTDGTPYFLCGPGDPEEFLYLGTRQTNGTRSGGGQTEKIDRLIDLGGNVIFTGVVRSHGGDGPADHNPFVDSNPSLGLDPEILDQWDGWFSRMDEGGITVFLAFYDDSACIWGCSKSSDHEVPAAEETFLRAIVDRFERYRNVIWVVAEEYQERFSQARASNMAAVIRDADDHDHPIGSTQLTGLVFHHADDPNLDLFGIQCQKLDGGSCDGSTTPFEINGSMNTAWDNAAGRHNITLSEIRYAGTGTGERARKVMWATAMGGAYFLANGWDLTGAADPPDSNLRECRWLEEFLESVPLQHMAPDNARGAGDTDYALVVDEGEHGAAYVLYTDSYGSGVGVTGLVEGHWSVRWLDTVTGATAEDSFDQPSPGTAILFRPQALGAATEIAVSLRRCADADADGSCEPGDNCPGVPNPGQNDADGDGAGDACDPCPGDAENDFDGDGVCAPTDNCPRTANGDQSDLDGDGRGDACDHPVRITEVHYDQASGEQEFVELLAVGFPVDVTGWRLGDQDEMEFVFDSSDARFPCAEPFVLAPGDRVVVLQGSGLSVCEGTERRIYLGTGTFLQKAGDDLLLRSATLDCQDYVAFESASTVNPPPPDCPWAGPNPSNLDVPGTSLARFDADPMADTGTADDWEASGATTTLGPSTPAAPNEQAVDIDGDGLIDRADNCSSVANEGQSDGDSDGEGDRCDLDDGSIVLWAPGSGRVEWQEESGIEAWNRYRGDLRILREQGIYTQDPAQTAGARRDCGLADPWIEDADAPSPGEAFFSLVTGIVSGAEGTLGNDSSGAERPNDHPCP